MAKTVAEAKERGLPIRGPFQPVKPPLPTTDQWEDEMLRYCMSLSKSLSQIHAQVKEALPTPATGPLHDLRPWVVIKDTRRKLW